MSFMDSIFGKSLSVPNNPTARNIAAHELIRPREVQHLVNIVPASSVPSTHASGNAVADNLKRLLASRQLRYYPDPQSDIWSSPRATLLRGGGDCEDLAILTVSMLRHTHGDTALSVGTVWSPPNQTWIGHAWVEGIDEKGHFLIEATNGEIMRLRGGRPNYYRLNYYVGLKDQPIAA